MGAAKSKRNKTIDFVIDDETRRYTDRLLMESDDLMDMRLIRDRTIVGDSFQIMKKLPQGFVDLALIDPPYNLTKRYEGMTFHQMSDEDYQQYTREWVNLLLPLLKDTATVYVFSDWRTSIVIAPVLMESFIMQNRITWQREKGRGAKHNFKNSMEDIWFLTRSDKFMFDADAVKQRRRVIAPYREHGLAKDWEETENGRFRDTAPSNFWDDISVPYWSMPENTAHPTQKPEKLMAKVILASSKRDDMIFDPFSGSGSSLVTAKKLGRHWIGVEQSMTYAAWGEYRLELADSHPDIQGYTNGVFWERNTLAEQQKALNEKNRKSGRNTQSESSYISSCFDGLPDSARDHPG